MPGALFKWICRYCRIPNLEVDPGSIDELRCKFCGRRGFSGEMAQSETDWRPVPGSFRIPRLRNLPHRDH